VTKQYEGKQRTVLSPTTKMRIEFVATLSSLSKY
jgi:hypothetical protein